MKKFVSIISTLLILLLLLGLCSCKNSQNTEGTNDTSDDINYIPINMSVACMTGPTGVGMAKLMADNDAKLTANNYTFTVESAATEINAKFLNGEINIASVPTNVAATLYNKTKGKVRMLAVNTYGVLSILEKGNTIKSISDLKGKTIYSTGKGQNPEYILKYILEKNKIDPEKDVTINFVSSEDLVAKLISGEAEVAMAPEPAATTVMIKNQALNRVLSINDEWSKICDTKLMMGCIIALDSYVESNQPAITKFLEEYSASIEFAKTNVDEVAKHCATYKIAASEPIAKKAIPNCNLAYVVGQEMMTNVKGYLNVLHSANPSSIGDNLPSDDFYLYAQ